MHVSLTVKAKFVISHVVHKLQPGGTTVHKYKSNPAGQATEQWDEEEAEEKHDAESTRNEEEDDDDEDKKSDKEEDDEDDDEELPETTEPSPAKLTPKKKQKTKNKQLARRADHHNE